MIILWDSSDKVVRGAIVSDEKNIDFEWNADRTLARDMLAYLRELLDKQGCDFCDISGIGIFRGPGSYTGLRIGMAVLNTIADSEKIPIVGAMGDNWREEALKRLRDGQDDKIVLPEYGGEANITLPRK